MYIKTEKDFLTKYNPHSGNVNFTSIWREYITYLLLEKLRVDLMKVKPRKEEREKLNCYLLTTVEGK